MKVVMGRMELRKTQGKMNEFQLCVFFSHFGAVQRLLVRMNVIIDKMKWIIVINLVFGCVNCTNYKEFE